MTFRHQSTAVVSSMTRSSGVNSLVTPSTLVTEPPSVPETADESRPLLDQPVEIGRVDIEPDDVGEGHVGRGQHSLEIKR
jgi:hypothetical protein